MMNESATDLLLSVVFPCLNEAGTLERCLREVQEVLDSCDWSYEIIVSDNGSSDGSQDIAKKEGCRVVQSEPRGYGAAVQGGIRHAKGEWIVFLDADGTYCAEDIPRLVSKAIVEDADMVLANRLSKPLPQGAMPFLHRYLGTPILSWCIRLLHGTSVRDCNSGMRCLKKTSYEKWGVEGQGMEFASELLVLAAQNSAKVDEIPSSLRAPAVHRNPKLSTWRDGMRHLLVILYHAPKFFERWGGLAVVLTFILHVMALVMGRTKIGPVEIFDVHTSILLFGGGLLAMQCYGLGTMLYSLQPTKRSKSWKVTRWLVHLKPAETLLLVIILTFIFLIGVGVVITYWGSHGFSGLKLTSQLLFFSHVTILPLAGIIMILGIQFASISRKDEESAAVD